MRKVRAVYQDYYVVVKRLQQKIIPITAIIWCFAVIIDHSFGDRLGLSFINVGWAPITILTALLFVLLFSSRLITDLGTKRTLLYLLGAFSAADFILSLFLADRTYISSTITSVLFLLLTIHGFYLVRDEKFYLRFILKFAVYIISNCILIFYFLNPFELYKLPGFESISWTTGLGFLLYSSTLLSTYYGDLIKKSNLPEDLPILNKKFVNFWFVLSFFFPVLVIFVISFLHFFEILSPETGMALGLFFVCLLPFPMTYLIYLETVDWNVEMYNKNRKLFHREQDVQFHNELLEEFAQITSHNLRGPLLGLETLLDLSFEEDTTEEERIATFKLIREKVPVLTKMIDSLSDFYDMIQTGEVKYIECNIRQIFEEALIECTNNADIKKEKYSIEFDLRISTIEYPQIYFKSLAYNLVSNAIKYRKKNRPLVIRIATSRLDSEGVLLTFRDNGLGMNLKYFRNKIFKFGTTYHNFSNSTGVGMFIIKKQLNRLGDDIEVESEEGQFTEFKIRFNFNGRRELGFRW